uniref:Uncharacterized protein n=1 Tax=Neospora caninum (strain Liverpool) TaxID=572307 RepID=A0A0F7UQV3_NEOCL|nr:TPA: hypothetical protein BN1204_065225 [Neospora caninum Liverpool]
MKTRGDRSKRGSKRLALCCLFALFSVGGICSVVASNGKPEPRLENSGAEKSKLTPQGAPNVSTGTSPVEGHGYSDHTGRGLLPVEQAPSAASAGPTSPRAPIRPSVGSSVHQSGRVKRLVRELEKRLSAGRERRGSSPSGRSSTSLPRSGSSGVARERRGLPDIFVKSGEQAPSRGDADSDSQRTGRYASPRQPVSGSEPPAGKTPQHFPLPTPVSGTRVSQSVEAFFPHVSGPCPRGVGAQWATLVSVPRGLPAAKGDTVQWFPSGNH